MVHRVACTRHMHHSFGDCFFTTPPPQNPLAQYIHPAQAEGGIDRADFTGREHGPSNTLGSGAKMHTDLGVSVWETDSHRRR